MLIGPALPLSLLIGLFHTALYVLIRGSAGGRLPLVYAAAVVGAWAGDAVGARLGIEVLTVGDYGLVGASVVAWIGIGLVSVLALLGPEGRPLPRWRGGR